MRPEAWVLAVIGLEPSIWVWVARVSLVVIPAVLAWFLFVSPLIKGKKLILPYSYRPDDTDIMPIRRLMPLPTAAQFAYERLRGRTPVSKKLPAQFADMPVGGTAKPIGWFGTALLGQGSIPLFGHHPPSTVLEIVPHSIVDGTGHLNEDANSIMLFGKDQPEYTELFIKVSDYKERLKEIESWHGENT